jgi:hypothetical protein
VLTVHVRANVGSRDGQLGCCAAPVTGADAVDAVADRCGRERVDPVQPGIGRVRASWGVGVSWAAVILACCRATTRVCVQRA